MMFSRSFAVHAGFVPRGQTFHRLQDRFQRRLQIWMLERVVSASTASGDLRWMAAALAASALTALETVAQKVLVRLARHTMARALRGARFAGAVGTADSMVAAAGR
ncbi:MAG: hypothetical protein JO141_20865 [Bradyrhizobium sp.]|nr:hypothetical protein [Bradyrhizobium sp.]